ncbi:uncharacterized protein LOC124115940 [Haliotis rufescens]|uniref:uncharacterized protein LOC124115940 n=1 Tax=Haliotis rufescens TaxID=6454 RepID=UPI00201EE9AB|nr:uncharacterized protein LOC124115940 [Haliotis rufescens]XP_046333067.2 uncharacterized protein LOC124115940 [Haliotis rufescens]
MQGPILVIPPVTRGGTNRKLTGPSARRGIWVKKPEEVYPGMAVLRERQAKTVSMTYTTVVNVPILRYATATPAEILEKRERIKEEKRDSADNMEKRISRFCHAYRMSIPETNSHSTIKKDAPWLTSRADGTEHSHVINATIPKVENGINQNDNDTIPLDLKQCHIFYSDTGIASWRLAMSKDGEIARVNPVKRNSSFREYTWRLSYLVCQGKRQMRLMARSKQERCGPLPLFSQHSLVRQLEFDMPEGNECYKQEGIPISRAVRILFQTADMKAFEKRMFNKKKGVVPKKKDKLEVEAHPVGLKLSTGCLCLPMQHDQEEDDDYSLEWSDDSANNGRIKSAEPTQSQLLEDLNREAEMQMQTPDPVNLPTPTPTPSPEGKAKKCCKGCCAFL